MKRPQLPYYIVINQEGEIDCNDKGEKYFHADYERAVQRASELAKHSAPGDGVGVFGLVTMLFTPETVTTQ